MSDDMDDILDGDRSRLEARFRELELQAEVERMRREQGGAPSSGAAHGASRAPSGGDADPLADMKAALGDDAKASGAAEPTSSGEVERYVLAICPHCDAKNRISLTRLRSANPRCGGCKQPLSYT